MEKILQNLDNVTIFFDDLVITGVTREEHDKNESITKITKLWINLKTNVHFRKAALNF